MKDVIDFVKNSKFFGSTWIDRKNKKIYVLPVEQTYDFKDYEMIQIDDENTEMLNDIFVLDDYKYSSKVSKLYKVTLKKTYHQIDNKIKWKVYRQYGFFCFYCNYAGELTYDHYVPTSKGGGTTVENGRPCCFLCNQSKGDIDPDVWMTSIELQEIIRKRKMHDIV